MKKTYILLLLLLMGGLQAVQAQKMVVMTTDNQVAKFDVSKVKDVTFEEATPIDDINDTHGWVDLGLPSGTLWATCNVGASSPEKCGDYFAWGETRPKENYNWITYKYCEGSYDTLTKYCIHRGYGYNGFTDNLTELLPEDDAATANWGSSWQMPSLKQIQELLNSSYTTITLTTQNDIKGYKITSNRNGKSIFLPDAGFMNGTSFGATNAYWSRTLGTDDSCDAYTYSLSSYSHWYSASRCWGRSVRPVRKQ